MKKGVAVMVVLAVLTMVGVSLVPSFAWEPPESIRAAMRGKTVTILYPALEYDKIGFEMFAPIFEQKYGAKVEFDLVPFPKMREISLLEASKRAGRYDIIGMDCMWIAEFVQANYIEDLRQYLQDPELYDPEYAIDDIVARAFAGSGAWEDGVYAYVFSPGVLHWVYNKPMFEKAGLSYPTNPVEMKEAARKMTNPEQNEYGFVCLADRGIGFGHTWLPHYVFPWGSEVFNEDWEVVLDSPESLASLKELISMREFAPPGTGVFGWDEVLSSFESGNCAMGNAYHPFNILLEDPTKSVLVGKIEYGPDFTPDGGLYGTFGSWNGAISTDSKNKKAAFLFLQLMTSQKYAKEWALKGGAPSRHSVLSDPEVRQKWPWTKMIHQIMTYDMHPEWRARIPEWGEVADIIGLWGNRAWIDEVTPEEAVREMTREVNALVKQVGYQDPKTAPPQNWRDMSWYDKLPSIWAGVDY